MLMQSNANAFWQQIWIQNDFSFHLILLFNILPIYIVQAWNFNFRTWKRKTIPFFPHKHRQCGKNRIVFLFQVRKLKFLACMENKTHCWCLECVVTMLFWIATKLTTIKWGHKLLTQCWKQKILKKNECPWKSIPMAAMFPAPSWSLVSKSYHALLSQSS